MKQPRRTIHPQQGSNAPGAGRLSEHRDTLGIATEGGDVVADPLQGGYLVEQATVVRCTLEMSEAFGTHAIVEGHDDHAAVPREPGPVVLRQTRHADQIAATLDPHQHRQPGDPLRAGRPDVDRQPVIPLGRSRGHAEVAALRRRWTVCQSVPSPIPALHRLRCGEAQCPDRRRGEGDATEDGDAGIPAAPHRPGGGSNLG